ncbi:hypothetical protein, partial [Rhodovulum sulfidophilum]|uniref:hypothetical protein n=1 Tax=Rhodovulum sulfidophilum TaxID=35806 RepID=UPI001F28058B
MISRMDPVGSSEEDRRLDWATARAWSHLASEGLHPELSDHDRRTVLKEGSSETDIASLETMLEREPAGAVDGHEEVRHGAAIGPMPMADACPRPSALRHCPRTN